MEAAGSPAKSHGPHLQNTNPGNPPVRFEHTTEEAGHKKHLPLTQTSVF